MYKIIGADGKEYGPVSAEQLRDWITQGRVSPQTSVRPEAGGDWQPLASYPELNSPPAGPPPVNPGTALPPPSLADRASKKVAAGICGILLGSLGIHKFILGYTTAGLIMLLCTLLTCGLAGVAFYIIGLIEGIIYLTKSDEEFVRIYVDGRKEWF
jgi:TM2 domain-containing membrane protein YozV